VYLLQHVYLVKGSEDPNTYLVNDTADPLQRSLTCLELTDVLMGAPPPGASSTWAPPAGQATLLLNKQICCSTCTQPCASCVCLQMSALCTLTSMSLRMKHATKLLLLCHMQRAYLPFCTRCLIKHFSGVINRITCLMLYG